MAYRIRKAPDGPIYVLDILQDTTNAEITMMTDQIAQMIASFNDHTYLIFNVMEATPTHLRELIQSLSIMDYGDMAVLSHDLIRVVIFLSHDHLPESISRVSHPHQYGGVNTAVVRSMGAALTLITDLEERAGNIID